MLKSTIFIIGMHRSGTSFLTNIISKSGAFIPTNLVKPSLNDNPEGFFEPANAVKINNQILDSCGSWWADIKPISINDIEFKKLEGIKQSIQAFIEEEYDNQSKTWVIKEPRLSRTLPLWIDQVKKMGREPVVIICTRHPSLCAKSLFKRNKIPIEYSMLSWINHTLNAEYASRSLPRIRTVYGEFFKQPERYLSALTNVLREFGVSIEALSERHEIIKPQISKTNGAEPMYDFPLTAMVYKEIIRSGMRMENLDHSKMDEMYDSFRILSSKHSRYSNVGPLNLQGDKRASIA